MIKAAGEAVQITTKNMAKTHKIYTFLTLFVSENHSFFIYLQ
jgi:hypothetical protein